MPNLAIWSPRALSLLRRDIRTNIGRSDLLCLIEEIRQIPKRRIHFAKLRLCMLQIIRVRLSLLEQFLKLLHNG